jgi:naphtho-gamma-pyrone polyketide synthase
MAQSNVQMSQLVAKYMIEVRKHQPNGPYHLGGWSAGGICAFEAARQLAEAGEVVESLILIDSPNPIGLQNPPARMYDFFESLGIFGGESKTIPAWLRKHFDAFIRLLDDYEPIPMSSAPSTLIVYARDGICKDDSVPRPEIRPDDPREMIWLINNRTDFAADGWASLVGRDRLNVRVMDNVNHFTMMEKGASMAELSDHIRQSVVKR